MTQRHIIVFLLSLAFSHVFSSIVNAKPHGAQRPPCEMQWYSQTVDHFSWVLPSFGATYQQRYCISSQYWVPGGPIFFYTGNEGGLEAYIANTGLMWEQAPKFKALVVFAEHRYYGASEVCGPDSWQHCPQYLTAEQALADYAALLTAIRQQLPSPAGPAVAFGGSYGGMLAAWFRLKYPHIVVGAVAASAPVWAFPNFPGHPFDPSGFWAIVTRDATAAAGAADDCARHVASAFEIIWQLSRSASGRKVLSDAFRTCDPLQTESDVELMAYWIQGAFDTLAMGNYPFASSYISGDPAHPLPPWPMRVACQHMHRVKGDVPKLEALREAVAVVYNASGAVQCYDLQTTGPAGMGNGIWDYHVCTALMPQEQPYWAARGPPADMFWKQHNWTLDDVRTHCKATFGVEPRPDWVPVMYGDLSLASNIIFSYGEYDPWTVGCVQTNLSDSLIAIPVLKGAHHLDLMFSTPDDPKEVTEVRQLEMIYVDRWIRSGTDQ